MSRLAPGPGLPDLAGMTGPRQIRLTSPHDILSAYSSGAISRGDAMRMLGLVQDLQLILAMLDVGHRLPLALAAPNDGYSPESIRVLAKLDPLRRRPTRHVEDVPDPAWLAMPPEERVAALERAVESGRVAIGVEELMDEEMERIFASKPLGDGDVVAGAQGETVRQIVREVYKCRTPEEEDRYLQRYLAA